MSKKMPEAINELDNMRLLSRVFTRPVFAEMAKTGDWHTPLNFLLKNRLVKKSKASDQPLSQLFDDAWDHLSKFYRNEYVYKNELASRLVFGRHSPKTAGFQIELPVGRSIVDVAVANGTTTAYEIKTEYDTSRRLRSQTSDYLRAFDKVYVVTHSSHAEKFEQTLDERVGLIVLSQKGSLHTYREARSNVENVEPAVIFRCLRRAEYLSAISAYFGVVPSLPNGLIAGYCEKLFAEIPPLDAHKTYVKALRSRTTNESTIHFVSRLPASLRALGYATPLSGIQRNTALSLLSNPVGLELSL